MINVIELFAGVGGFRVGLEASDSSFFKVIWSNQWEPSTKTQHASRTYVNVFGSEGHSNEDINTIKGSDIPECDMLVGGFPCQDYSVATTLNNSKGIEGKKGVLWWEICRIIEEMGEKAPKILFLENVDRLLQSPSKQRGRDFAMILNSLNRMGYFAEWRVINAADYGMPQRRKRTYILAYKKSVYDPVQWILRNSVFTNAFPVEYDRECPWLEGSVAGEPAVISEKFNENNMLKPFDNSGFMLDGKYYTRKVNPVYEGKCTTLGDILLKEDDESRNTITEDYYLTEQELERWEYAKGPKKFPRSSKDGHEYMYSEGGMAFPDSLDKPSRTIITSEMSKSPNRFTHIVKDPVNGRFRRLVPVELERLNMFPDNHTKGEADNKRGFFMGNALVCGIVTKVGDILKKKLEEYHGDKR